MKPTQVILNGKPHKTFKSLKEAKTEGKRLIKVWKKTDSCGIVIEYKFV